MGLPPEETTPVTEAIENYVERMSLSMGVVGREAERAVSDATRLLDPDTTPATTSYNLARLFVTWSQQAALVSEMMASNLVLLGTKTSGIVMRSSPFRPVLDPIAAGDDSPAPGDYVVTPGPMMGSWGEEPASRVGFMRPEDDTRISVLTLAPDLRLPELSMWLTLRATDLVQQPSLPSGPLSGKMELTPAVELDRHLLQPDRIRKPKSWTATVYTSVA